MPAFLYRCPVTRQNVQGWVAEDVDERAHHPVTCLACRRVHLVNPATGKVAGEDDD